MGILIEVPLILVSFSGLYTSGLLCGVATMRSFASPGDVLYWVAAKELNLSYYDKGM